MENKRYILGYKYTYKLNEELDLVSFPITNKPIIESLERISFFKDIGVEPMNSLEESQNIGKYIDFDKPHSGVIQLFCLRKVDRQVPIGVMNFTLISKNYALPLLLQNWSEKNITTNSIFQTFNCDYLFILGWSKFYKQEITKKMVKPIYNIAMLMISQFIQNLPVELRSLVGVFTSPRGQHMPNEKYLKYIKNRQSNLNEIFLASDEMIFDTRKVNKLARTTVRLANEFGLNLQPDITFGGSLGPVYFAYADKVKLNSDYLL